MQCRLPRMALRRAAWGTLARLARQAGLSNVTASSSALVTPGASCSLSHAIPSFNLCRGFAAAASSNGEISQVHMQRQLALTGDGTPAGIRLGRRAA